MPWRALDGALPALLQSAQHGVDEEVRVIPITFEHPVQEPRMLGRIELALAIESPIRVGGSGQARRVFQHSFGPSLVCGAALGRVEKCERGMG